MTMDQLKYQNIATLTQTIKAHYYLIKLTQLLVSVSVCSYIFSPSSLLVFFHYFKFYFSTLPSQFFNHNIDKNSMFLLCNGLLVFVGITKSFSGSSADDDKEKHSKYIEDDSDSQSQSQPQFRDVEANEEMLEKEAEEKIIEPHEPAEKTIMEIENCDEEEVQENMEKIILVDEEQGNGSSQIVLEEEDEKEDDEESELFDVADEEEEDKVSENDYYFVNEENLEEEEDVEEESCVLSTEELNKKFEDFIRKMKQDLRIEARRQLVLV